MNFPKIAHGDHPMSKAQLSWIQKHPEIAKMKEGAFICKVFKLPEVLGTIPSALYGPSVGDSVITEDDVVYMKRGDRDEPSRMVDMPCRPARNLCVIGLVGQVAFTMYGTQATEPAPREPYDKSISSDEERAFATKFWSEHGLSLHEPKELETTEIDYENMTAEELEWRIDKGVADTLREAI